MYSIGKENGKVKNICTSEKKMFQAIVSMENVSISLKSVPESSFLRTLLFFEINPII